MRRKISIAAGKPITLFMRVFHRHHINVEDTKSQKGWFYNNLSPVYEPVTTVIQPI